MLNVCVCYVGLGFRGLGFGRGVATYLSAKEPPTLLSSLRNNDFEFAPNLLNLSQIDFRLYWVFLLP